MGAVPNKTRGRLRGYGKRLVKYRCQCPHDQTLRFRPASARCGAVASRFLGRAHAATEGGTPNRPRSPTTAFELHLWAGKVSCVSYRFPARGHFPPPRHVWGHGHVALTARLVLSPLQHAHKRCSAIEGPMHARPKTSMQHPPVRPASHGDSQLPVELSSDAQSSIVGINASDTHSPDLSSAVCVRRPHPSSQPCYNPMR